MLSVLPDPAFLTNAVLLVIAVTSILANVANWRKNRPVVELKQPITVEPATAVVSQEVCHAMHADQERRFTAITQDIAKLWDSSASIRREQAEIRASFERSLGRIEGKLDRLLAQS